VDLVAAEWVGCTKTVRRRILRLLSRRRWAAEGYSQEEGVPVTYRDALCFYSITGITAETGFKTALLPA
jgi:hypothetical protein